jgi:Na+-driven multidrug efflux pump
MANDDQTTETDDGFDSYQENTLDPGPWMLIFTTVFCFGVMLVVVPLMVKWKIHSRKKKNLKYLNEEPLMGDTSDEDGTEITAKSVLSFDKEMNKILSLAIPFTISGLFTEICSSICLALVGIYIGTHALAAYALVNILVGLTDGVLQGPIHACTTLCAHAVGAGNPTLAGSYIQLAIFFYLLVNVPVLFLWFVYMRDVILFLEWGEEETAQMAEDYIRVYVFR